MIHNNRDLIETIKKILEVFPEGIIIQSFDKDSQSLVVKFTNNTAAKEIINYEDHYGKPIDDEQLSFVVKSTDNIAESNLLKQENSNIKELNLSDLLQSQIENTILNETEVVNSVELLNKQKSNSDESSYLEDGISDAAKDNEQYKLLIQSIPTVQMSSWRLAEDMIIAFNIKGIK